MDQQNRLLSRNNSLVLRGVAICFIVLHNFLHVGIIFSFTGENEMSFSSVKANNFFNMIAEGSNVICEFFSHLGWIGVPVFVFLTGYGIALTQPNSCDSFCFVKRNYLKLLALMLPAVLFFAGGDILKGDIWPGLLKRFSYLIMLPNFAYPFLRCSPGVYWYFGLTFQFYLLWAFLGKRMNQKNLLIWSVLLLCALYVISAYAHPNMLSIFRHCFTGWFPVFAIGVWWGISKNKKVFRLSFWTELSLFVVLLGLVLLMSKWMVTWLFIPIIALAWFIVIGLLLMRTRYLSEAFRWIGKFSACIFVCHPIARLIVLNTVHHYFTNITVNVLVYLALTIIISLLYNIVFQWLLKKMLPKTS